MTSNNKSKDNVDYIPTNVCVFVTCMSMHGDYYTTIYVHAMLCKYVGWAYMQKMFPRFDLLITSYVVNTCRIFGYSYLLK